MLSLWEAFWTIYVSSREYRQTKVRAAITALRNCWMVSRIVEPSLWEKVYEDLDETYVEVNLVRYLDRDLPVDTRYMLVATRKGWRPAKWWGHRSCPTVSSWRGVEGTPKATASRAWEWCKTEGLPH